ncbi:MULTISPECIES: hypothetical protein [unclassified Geodermatophilus]
MRVEERPLIRWVPVVDRHGHRHMEMRWDAVALGAPAEAPRLGKTA